MIRKEREEYTDLSNIEGGITLIALVVTVVVLLILAGVSISLILDNNGIIAKSKDARKEYGQAKINEQSDLDNTSDWIYEQVEGKTPKVEVNTKAEENSTINGKRGKTNNPTIPKGYIPINTDTAKWGDGTTAPSQDSVDHGLVIKDDKDNEWVWIPVSYVSVMCDTSNNTEYTLTRTKGETAVKTKLYSKSEIVTGITRVTPGEKGFGEPDLLSIADRSKQFYKDILGFESPEEMGESFVSDYKEMIESVKKYGGFYIGRYELSGTVEEPTEKAGPSLTSTNWYNFYKACKKFGEENDRVETRMIWGCQWDVVCNFIENNGEKKSIASSGKWGNFNNSYGDAAVMDGTTKKYGNKQNTGFSEYWKANNIYDLAGNCREWTQESTNNTYKRAGRGGYYGDAAGFSATVKSRTTFDSEFVDSTSSAVTSRPTMIIK